jgi:site-specific recombinase XerD
MSGLSFADDVEVSVDSPLLPVFVDWVSVLTGEKSRATVRAYVADVRLVSQALLEVLGRDVAPQDERPVAVRVPAGVSPTTYGETVRLVSALTLGDLHPRHLAEAFAVFGSSTPGRRRVTRPGVDDEPRRAATRRRAAAAWTALCEHARAHGLLAANPMRDPRISRGPKPTYSPTPFELHEAERLLRTVATADVARTSRRPWPARDLALASVLLTSGIRLSEACAVTCGDVRDLAGAAHLHVLGKGNKHRTVPLARATVGTLRTYLAERGHVLGDPGPSAALFVHHDGRSFTPRSMQHLVYRWYARAGITPRGESCVHALRHTFATQLVNSSASIVEVMELLGHESLDTTKRYLQSVGHGLRDAVEANPGAHLVHEVTRVEVPTRAPLP